MYNKSSVLLDSLINESNKTVTENGATTNTSSVNDLLDLFAMGGALRSRSENDIVDLFLKAFALDKLLALKTMFYIRDCRGGQGERRTFRAVLKYLGDHYPNIVKKNIHLIPFYGRWDDLFVLFDTKSEKEMLSFVKTQFMEDMTNYTNDKTISILAKWLPSVNTSSYTTSMLGKRFAKYLELSEKDYRKVLSKLREKIDVTEKKMCRNDWNKIIYKSVPSKAMVNYTRAFYKHDNDNFSKYIMDVHSGKEKINVSVLYPVDVLKCFYGYYEFKTDISQDIIDTRDAQWKSLPNYIKNDKNILVVADTSGSMFNDRSSIAVAISLALYCSERITGPFKDYWINFSDKPSLQKVKGHNIYEKVRNINYNNWGSSTNIIGVFELLLRKMVESEQNLNRKLTKDELPTHILIISDMEFNSVGDLDSYVEQDKTTYEHIKEMYESNGYSLPKIVWWNVDSRQNNLPVKESDKGNVMISGYSPVILKTLLENDTIDPVMMMLQTINTERYKEVTI